MLWPFRWIGKKLSHISLVSNPHQFSSLVRCQQEEVPSRLLDKDCLGLCMVHTGIFVQPKNTVGSCQLIIILAVL